jgi:hypothetical protein
MERKYVLITVFWCSDICSGKSVGRQANVHKIPLKPRWLANTPSDCI